MQFEARIIQVLQAGASGGWVYFFMGVTGLAGFLGLVMFAAIIFVKDKKLALFYCLTFGAVALFNLILKSIIKRPRPFDSFPGILNLGGESGYSMPSSHSALAAMTAVFVCYLVFKLSKNIVTRTLVCIVMTLFVAMIMLSRMVLGVHYLTDTIAGVAEGLMLGVAGIWAYKSTKGRKRT